MKNCVFTLYNNLSCRYGDVMSYPTEGFAQKVLSTQLPKMNMDLSEYELCKIGEIDVLTGVIEPCPGTIQSDLLNKSLNNFIILLNLYDYLALIVVNKLRKSFFLKGVLYELRS